MTDLTKLQTHYSFGENWASFSKTVDEEAIRHAEEGVLKLLSRDELKGRSWLDVGSGSGLHSLAAARLGVSRILATDIDPNSVATTRALVSRYAPQANIEARELSVFDMSPADLGTFDIVYSWGVLHHTGNMWTAIGKAADMVKPGGLFALALYRRTSTVMDKFWTYEKRKYTAASPETRARWDRHYIQLYKLAYRVRGRDFDAFVGNYKSLRGNSFAHDVSDWMGGYPYEVVSSEELAAFMSKRGFSPVRKFVQRRTFGLFGSGCDEFTFRRES